MNATELNRPRAAGRGTFWLSTLVILAAAVAFVLVLRHAPLKGILDPWYLTRASGLVAYVLLWAAISLGLAQSGGLMKGLGSAAANLDLHDYLSVLSIYATAFHLIILLWDRYVGFRLSELLIPFASHYQRTLLGLGGLAFYVGLLAAVTTYYRARLGNRAWRLIHRASAVAFILAWFHGVGAGTDFRLSAVSLMYAVTGLIATALLVFRILNVRPGYARPDPD